MLGILSSTFMIAARMDAMDGPLLHPRARACGASLPARRSISGSALRSSPKSNPRSNPRSIGASAPGSVETPLPGPAARRARLPGPTRRRAGLAPLVAGLIARLRGALAHARTRRILEALSDHQLRDIGLTRDRIAHYDTDRRG